MGWELFVSEYSVVILAAVVVSWAIWVSSKIYSFKRQTMLQKAISKPQLRQLRIRLFKGTLVAFTGTILVFWLPTLLLTEQDFQVVLYSPLVCLLPMILCAFGYLQSEIQFLRFYSYPLTDQMDVPIQGTPNPPPHAEKSFEDLLVELEKALEKLEEKERD